MASMKAFQAFDPGSNPGRRIFKMENNYGCSECEIDFNICPDIFINFNPNTNPTLIKSYDYWHLFVDYLQPTLGSCIVVPDRHVTSFSDLKSGEEIEYQNKIIYDIRVCLFNSFGANSHSYFENSIKISHFNIRIIPRYEKSVEFAGRTWEDNIERFEESDFDFSGDKIDQKVLDLIIEKMRINL